MDYEKIKEAAQNYQDDMTRFLRAIVKTRAKAAMRESTSKPSKQK